MYTIGEFSNLAHVSARSLRYYDAMGLLRPAHMGENGYRYYTGGQLPALAKIETLKSYGFTLAEVKELLLLPETELAHRIHVRRISAYAQLNEMRRVIRRIVPFPVSWTVKMKKKQKETQDILSYHTQAAGCSDKARAKASGGRQPIEECGRTGL